MLRRSRMGSQSVTLEEDAASFGMDETVHGAEECCLPGAASAEEGDGLACIDCEGDTTKDRSTSG